MRGSALRGGERGLSMVEMMASVLVFAIITLGITPLLMGAVRGAALSRSFTVGKNAAQQAMERIRGLPFFISFATQNQKVDVLDLYFPDLLALSGPTGTGYDAANQRYQTVCTATTVASKPCPSGLASGFTVTYHASFVEPSGGSVETYTTVIPAPAYAWNSPTSDLPPSRIVKMDVVVSWNFSGIAKNYTLSSLIGDRKVASDRISGRANVDYVVQVLTSYEDPLGRISDLSARFGEGESKVETRLLSQAEVTARAAGVRLVRPGQGATDDAVELNSLAGAVSQYSAPPDSADPAATASKSGESMSHPDLGDVYVAGMTESVTKTPLKAKVANELPIAAGGFGLNTTSASTFDGWVNTQAAVGSQTALLLDATPLSNVPSPPKPMASLNKFGGVSPLLGSTSATTGAMGTIERRVQTTATAAFGQLNLFPVSFVGSGNPDERTLIQIQNFSGSVDCKSTASTTATATATYSATLKFWTENDWSATNQFGDGSTAGGYRTRTLSSANATDPLDDLNPSPDKNPLAWEDPLSADPIGSPKDIYLFPIHHDHGTVSHDHPGYLDPAAGWDSLVGLSSQTEVLNEGKTTTAGMPGAITINTIPFNPSVPSSNLSITIGSLACTASDLR